MLIEIYNLLINPITAINISFAGIIVSILGVLYNRNLNEITRQQLELDKSKFLAEIARQGPLLQIAKGIVVYSLETSSKREVSDILRGKLKGYHRKSLFGSEEKISFSDENHVVTMKEVYLELSFFVSNISDVPIKLDNVSVSYKFRPKMSWYFRFNKLVSGFTSSPDLYSEKYCEFMTKNNKIYRVSNMKSGFVGYLDKDWEDFSQFFIKIHNERDLIDENIKFIDEKTLQPITGDTFILQPKSKNHWKIKIRFTKRAARTIVTQGYGPKDVTVVLPWEGDFIAKYKQLDHVYTIDNSKNTQDYWTIKIDDLEYL